MRSHANTPGRLRQPSATTRGASTSNHCRAMSPACACASAVTHATRQWRLLSARTAPAQAGELAQQWHSADAPREVADGWRSRPGVFAWDRIDPASALLIDYLPRNLTGRAADLGAGTGVLAAALLERNPQLERLDLYEASARALELARENLGSRTTPVQLGFEWHDVTAGLDARFDAIVMNPPFHLGRADAPDLGRAFIAAAAQALRPGGRLWLVANRHLPYEAALAQDFAEVREVADVGGFKVIVARKAERR